MNLIDINDHFMNVKRDHLLQNNHRYTNYTNSVARLQEIDLTQ